MQSKLTQNKYNEEASALISQEWQLVLQGKNAEQLVEIIQQYELDPLTSFIQHNQQMLKIYVWALLITGNYLQISVSKDQSIQQLQKAPLTAIAEAGADQNVNQLCKSFTEYKKLLNDRQLLSRMNEATLKAVLTILSKYFTTYSSSQIVSWFCCKQQDIRKLGYTVEKGYVELKKQQKTRDCLLNKLRELVIVSNKMSKFE